MKRANAFPVIVALGLLGGCASFDAQDRFILGEATRANIAAQSDRDVDLPNSRKVEATSGVRAVNAVKALNDGQTKELASAGTGGAE
jgi:type IV pilus biogenesis protein CpaD/CtpE